MYLGPGKLVKVTCDWMGNFARYLQQGWKLTDIFWDQGKKSHGGIYTSCKTIIPLVISDVKKCLILLQDVQFATQSYNKIIV